MKKILILTALSIAIPLYAAGAQELPGWPAKASCSAGDNACPFFERDARGQVSGIWPTLPPEIRASCVSETAEVEKSYRLLLSCLTNKMQEHVRLGWQHNS